MTRPTLFILDYNKEDNTSKRGRIIQDYESFTWIERFSGFGEFKLTIPWSPLNSTLYKVGTFISLDRSFRIMRVATYSVERDSQGGLKILLTGLSLEDIFNHRYIKKYLAGLSDGRKNFTYRSYEAYVIMRTMYRRFCSDLYSEEIRLLQRPLYGVTAIGTDTAPSVYPGYVGKEFPKETHVVESGTMASYFTKMYEDYRIGISFLRNNFGTLLFWVIRGRDRSVHSDFGDPVTFEEYNGDITNVQKLVSSVDEKPGAIFVSDDAWAVHISAGTGGYSIDTKYDLVEVQGDDEDASITPEELKSMAITHVAPVSNQTTITLETTDKTRPIYDQDYILGDIVNVSDPEGGYIKARVVEYTFIYDPGEGYSEHPTFEDYKV